MEDGATDRRKGGREVGGGSAMVGHMMIVTSLQPPNVG